MEESGHIKIPIGLCLIDASLPYTAFHTLEGCITDFGTPLFISRRE